MSVKNILQLVGPKVGLDPTDTNSRAVLIRWLNEAARELYDQADLQGSMIEVTCRVNGDQTITLPNDVEQVRAIRESASQRPWHANKMRPRYNDFNWKDSWRNFRLKDKKCLMATVTNTSVGVLTVLQVENPPVVVTVSGPIQGATCVSEEVTMDAISKQTINAYLDYTSVTKTLINNYDITLSDVDGKILTVLPNNQLEAIYQCVDISTFPWLTTPSNPLDNYVEMLYKRKLPYLNDDNQEFPAIGYDYILVNKMLQLWGEEQGKTEMAMAYDSKATRSAGRKQEEQNRETEDVVALVMNPHDTILRRIGTGMRRRYFFGRRW